MKIGQLIEKHPRERRSIEEIAELEAKDHSRCPKEQCRCALHVDFNDEQFVEGKKNAEDLFASIVTHCKIEKLKSGLEITSLAAKQKLLAKNLSAKLLNLQISEEDFAK
jgi:hypothetical protein